MGICPHSSLYSKAPSRGSTGCYLFTVSISDLLSVQCEPVTDTASITDNLRVLIVVYACDRKPLPCLCMTLCTNLGMQQRHRKFQLIALNYNIWYCHHRGSSQCKGRNVLVWVSALCFLQCLDTGGLGERKNMWPINTNLCHLSPSVLFQNKMRCNIMNTSNC